MPNIGSAREFASKQVEAIVRRIASIAMDNYPRARAADELQAGEFLLAIALALAATGTLNSPIFLGPTRESLANYAWLQEARMWIKQQPYNGNARK